MAKPTISVRPAVPADAAAITNIYFDAFGTDMSRALYPAGRTAAVRAKFTASEFENPEPEPGMETRWVVAEAAGEDGPEVVAFGKYGIVQQPRSEAEWHRPHVFTQEDVGAGASVDAFNNFLGVLHEKRAEWVKGDAHVYLSMLGTMPTRQRLGAGSAILRWGAAVADEAGVPLWLEASPAGYPLYLRHGFVPVDVYDYPLAAQGVVQQESWGQASVPGVTDSQEEGTYRSVVMRRG